MSLDFQFKASKVKFIHKEMTTVVLAMAFLLMCVIGKSWQPGWSHSYGPLIRFLVNKKKWIPSNLLSNQQSKPKEFQFMMISKKKETLNELIPLYITSLVLYFILIMPII